MRLRPLAWRAGLVALLLAEGLALSVLFDSAPHLGDDRWWALLLVRGPRLVGRLVIGTAVAMLLIAGPGMLEALRRDEWGEGRGRGWTPLIGHLAALAGFARLTAVVSMGDLGSAPHPGGWVIAWAAMGVFALGTWAAAALWPAGPGRPITRRGAGRLVAGVAVAAAAGGAGLAVEQVLWSPLDGSPMVRATFRAVSGLLGLVLPDTVCRPAEAVIGTRDFTVSIAPVCSGYEGMGLIAVFLGTYLALNRPSYRFPRALLLLPLGVAAMWLANVARIALLVGVGVWISPAVAADGFHSQSGWLAFNAIALGLIVGTRRIPFFTRAGPRDEGGGFTNPVAPYTIPLLAILATAMLTGAFSSGFDRFYPLRVVAAAGALWHFRRDYARWRWTCSWPALAIGAVTFALWMALEPAPASTGALAAGLAGLPPAWAATWLAFRVAGSVVTVPIAEELAFRGYLTRRLIAADCQEVPLGRFTWPSFLLSSAVFGALHGRWLAGTLAGTLYALALYRRRALGDAVAAHATTNALIAAHVLATGSWSLWS